MYLCFQEGFRVFNVAALREARVFYDIRQLMTLPDKEKRKIGFLVKEKKAVYMGR